MTPVKFVDWLEKFSKTIEDGHGLSRRQWSILKDHLAPTIAEKLQPIASPHHHIPTLRIPSENPDRIDNSIDNVDINMDNVAILGGRDE